MKVKFSVSKKLALIWFVLISVFALLSYFYLSQLLKDFIISRTQESLKRQLLFVQSISNANFTQTKNINSLIPIITKAAENLGMRATLLDDRGKVIADSSLDAKGIQEAENHLLRPEVQASQRGTVGLATRFSVTVGVEMMYAALPIGEAPFAGFIRLAVPLSDIYSLEQRLQKSMLVIFVGLLFVLGFSFWFVAFLVSRPLHLLSQVARRIANGEYSAKAAIYSQDEIGDLAANLSIMAEAIQARIEMVHAQQTKLEAVLTSMSEGVIVTDEGGKALLINPSARKLFFLNELLTGKEPLEILRNNAVQDLLERVLKQAEALVSEEITFTYPHEKIIQVNAVPILKNQAVQGAVLVFHDITPLRQLEKVRQDFVANVSHELRTPLSSIRGYSETLLAGALEDTENARDFISIIFKESERLSKLINDILDLSKIESGRMDMKFAPLSIGVVINRIVAILQQPAEQKKISLKVSIPDDLPFCRADEVRMQQVFLNLIDNAIKYTPEGGEVTISGFKVDDMLQINVCDTGIGIPPEDVPRIFERFYRVDKARSRDLGGTGLGLSIVKHIILAHKGNVWVSSVLNQGSTFSVTLPLK